MSKTLAYYCREFAERGVGRDRLAGARTKYQLLTVVLAHSAAWRLVPFVPVLLASVTFRTLDFLLDCLLRVVSENNKAPR